MSNERSTQSATMVSGPAPSERRWWASWLARSSSVAVAQRLRRRRPARRRPGVRAACWANSSGMVASGIARAVSFHVGQDGAALVGRENVEAADGAGRAPPRRRSAAGSRRSASVATVASSNRSAAYSSTPVDAGGRAVGGALLGQRERQVELGAGDRHLLEGWCAVPAARGSPGRRSGTPASPGTADDATASAPG